MNNHFLDIEEKLLSLKNKHKELVEKAYNLMQTDAALSECIYFEADKLLEKIKKLT